MTRHQNSIELILNIFCNANVKNTIVFCQKEYKTIAICKLWTLGIN